MNEKIPFKKDIIFKSIIGEITDITLNHDYLIKNDTVEGVFYLSGKYKMTEASVIEEEFFYNIPFSIAISERIDKDTINLTLDSFDYKINKDTLTLNLNLNMAFDNVVEDAVISKNQVGDINYFERGADEEIKTKFDDIENENKIEIEDSEVGDVNIVNEENIITSKETNNILDFTKNNIGDNYTSYKVVMMRDDMSLENILTKYDVNIEDIKNINNTDNIKVGDKIIIPIIKNEL